MHVSALAEAPAPAHGSHIDRFRIVRTLGVGGMGVVHAAHDPELDREVAVKLIRGNDSEAARTRLYREAQALAARNEALFTDHWYTAKALAGLISFARAVTTPEERLQTVTLAEATPEMADMRTMVIVGNRDTRRVGQFIYTPRRAG